LEEEDRWRVAVGERGRCGEVKIRWTRAWWMLRVFFSFYFYFFMFFLIKKKKSNGPSPGTCPGWPGSSFAYVLYHNRFTIIRSCKFCVFWLFSNLNVMYGKLLRKSKLD
jgi:hypothetical protein